MKKLASFLLLLVFAVSVLTACGAPAATDASDAGVAFDTSKEIVVVSREEGSGTRGAFIELFGIEVKNDDGSKTDMTTKEAIITNQTNVMMTTVAGNEYAIGYVSLGSLNDTVKALQIDGVTPSAENVKNGSYAIARPFNIVTGDSVSELAQDFMDFILSAEGQAVVATGYIAVDDGAAPYAGSKPAGKIVVAGSSSVTPIMEKLKEAYIAVNPDATIEIQQSDSSAGINGAIDGTCDIGMASRDLKDSELESLACTQIALDGIAVIANNSNPLVGLTKEQVRAIFTGELLVWSEVA